MDLGIRGRKALVCGASKGLGKACAMALAADGADVFIVARTAETIEKVAREISETTGATVTGIAADVTTPEGREAMLSLCPEPDILINNAGLALGLDKVDEGDIEQWEDMIDTNVKGLLYVTHYVVKGMLERDHGHIINIGSISSYAVYPGGSVYCATKYAVRAVSEGIKMDVHESSLRVTQIDPGMVDTEFSAVRFKGDRQQADSVYQGFDPLHAKDIAEAILYAVNCPPHVDVRQLLVLPTAQTAVGMIFKNDVV